MLGGEIDYPPNFTSPAQQNQKQAGRAEFQREKTKIQNRAKFISYTPVFPIFTGQVIQCDI